ncbi:MAG: thioesterase family protein [Xanthobacteraceae bacterium]|nr:thioesterase family protein [Xanthobacteraceae bacterium]
MREIHPGLKGEYTLLVQPDHLASKFKDDLLPQVLATPMMILAMENAALNAIRPCLEPNESAVGSSININHLAATPVGHKVRGFAEVTKVDGKRIEFKISAHDEVEEIGRGTHERIVINLARFNERLALKKKA